MPVRARWLRFQVARPASLLLSVLVFPLLAPAVGTSLAYWSCWWPARRSTSAWTVTGRPPGPARHTAGRPPRGRSTAAGSAGPRRRAVAAAIALAAVWLDAFLVVVSVFMVVVATTTLVFQLYKWWRPEHNDPHRYGTPGPPQLPGAILVPMRDEEAVAGPTLRRLATLDHPRYWVVPIVDHGDDMATARIAHVAARRAPDRVLVCPYPEDTQVHNKPIGLNRAVRMLHDLEIPYEWVGIADAEDVFHPELLRMVDHRFRTTGAGIVQCGVQLMNATTDPSGLPLPPGPLGRARRWWRAHASGWWRAANCWSTSSGSRAGSTCRPRPGDAARREHRVLPPRVPRDAAGGQYGEYWDEQCLTEDCKIGMIASVLGYAVDVIYVDELVTREETPGRCGVRAQRVRWMQGFIQVFAERRMAPAADARASASSPCTCSGSSSSRPPPAWWRRSVFIAGLVHKAPVAIVLAAVPFGIGVLNVCIDVLMLDQFG